MCSTLITGLRQFIYCIGLRGTFPVVNEWIKAGAAEQGCYSPPPKYKWGLSLPPPSSKMKILDCKVNKMTNNVVNKIVLKLIKNRGRFSTRKRSSRVCFV
jgi:hypothetical protein